MRLGINIDHVATLRNARGGAHPDPLQAALVAGRAGADLITAHLREDRRHMRDADMACLRAEQPLPLNMEMAVTAEMLQIALRLKPDDVCLVPERRQEVTTEGGLDATREAAALRRTVGTLQDALIKVALFIDPEPRQVEAALASGARAVEFHTGSYANAAGAAQGAELQRLRVAASQAREAGLEVHAGHGLTFANVASIAAIAPVEELNIGHFLMGEALFSGLDFAIRRMKEIMLEARLPKMEPGGAT